MLSCHAKETTPNRDDTAYHRIIVSAIELYLQYGVARTSIRDIANLADVSSSLVVYHFGSKKALNDSIEQFIRADVNHQLSEILKSIPVEEDCSVQLYRYFAQAFDLLAENKSAFSLLLASETQLERIYPCLGLGNPRLQSLVDEASRRGFTMMLNELIWLLVINLDSVRALNFACLRGLSHSTGGINHTLPLRVYHCKLAQALGINERVEALTTYV